MKIRKAMQTDPRLASLLEKIEKALSDHGDTFTSRSDPTVHFGTLLDWRRTTSQKRKRFRGGFVLKAHRLVYHSTLGSRVIMKK
jgi:hypothetical protein